MVEQPKPLDAFGTQDDEEFETETVRETLALD